VRPPHRPRRGPGFGAGPSRRAPALPPLARNLALLAAVAAVLTAIGSVGGTLVWLVWWLATLAMLAGFVYFGYTIWRENRGTFSLMSARLRWLLYGSSAAIVLLVVTSFLWVHSFASAVVFFVLLGALGYGVYRVWNESRRYYY
jgi:hypothetical protein